MGVGRSSQGMQELREGEHTHTFLPLFMAQGHTWTRKGHSGHQISMPGNTGRQGQGKVVN